MSHPSGGRIEPSRDWHQSTLLFLFALLLFRIVYLALLPIDLVHDEAYYWDWSRHLDYGYYSKPPGIAWLIGLSTALLGSSEFGVRFPAALLSTATLYFGFLLGRRMFSAKVGFIATILAAVTPGNAALGTVMTIDAPLLFLWSVALYGFWNMLHAEENRYRWTLVTMVAVGCGLLCKQTMIAFPALCLIFVVLNRDYAVELRRPSFWFCGLAAIGFLSPVVWWNYQHDWITFRHTGEHFAGGSHSVVHHLVLGLEFLCTQLAVVSPVTWVLMIAALVTIARLGRSAAPHERFLMTFSALPLLGVFLLSFRQRVEPNWPAPFYASGIVLVVGCLCGNRIAKFNTKTLRWAIVTGAVVTAATYALPFLIVSLGLKATQVDAVVRMWGWEQLGREVGAEFAQVADTKRTMLLVTGGRTMASELAFYLPDQPEVYLWNPNQPVSSQYDLWGLPDDRRGWNVMIVSKNETIDPCLAACFETCEKRAQVVVDIAKTRSHRVQIWHGTKLVGWRPDAVSVANRTHARNRLE